MHVCMEKKEGKEVGRRNLQQDLTSIIRTSASQSTNKVLYVQKLSFPKREKIKARISSTFAGRVDYRALSKLSCSSICILFPFSHQLQTCLTTNLPLIKALNLTFRCLESPETVSQTKKKLQRLVFVERFNWLS